MQPNRSVKMLLHRSYSPTTGSPGSQSSSSACWRNGHGNSHSFSHCVCSRTVYQRTSDPKSSIEDTKLPHNEEAPTANVFQPIHDTEETEVLHLETITCSTSDVDTHALADNFHGAGTQEPTKPYTICTRIWVLNKDKSLARSGITIWWSDCIFHCNMTCSAWICYVF